VHHVGILYDQIMMHGQRNIKWCNGSAVELHACRPTCHVSGCGYIKICRIVYSMMNVPWSPGQDSPTHFGFRRPSSAIGGGRRCWHS